LFNVEEELELELELESESSGTWIMWKKAFGMAIEMFMVLSGFG
jgi:hypothetical protein